MSKRLADSLVNADSAAAFLQQRKSRLDAKTLSALKSEIDRLVGSDLNRAAQLARRIEDLAALTKNPIAQAYAQAARARVLDHQGNHAQANQFYEAAIKALCASHLKSEAAVLQKQQLHALVCLGRYDEALRVASSARQVLAKTDALQLAQLEANIGNIYYRQDRYKQALAHYDKAWQTLAKVKNEAMRAPLEYSRANVFLELDKPDEALRLYETAAKAFTRAGRDLQACQSRFHIAYLQFKRGNYNAALASYYELRDNLTALGSDDLVAFCHQDIAEILLALNAFDDALENARLARESFIRLDMPYESAQAAIVHGLAAMGAAKFEQAEGDFNSAREIITKSGNAILKALVDTYLAELALRRDDAEEAARRAAQALRVFSRHKLATKSSYARLLAARAAYQKKHYGEASRKAKAALQEVEGLFANNLVYQAHHLLGLIERDKGRPTEALNHFRRAVTCVERMRGGIAADEFKSAFLRDKIQVYEDAIKACLDEGSDALVEEAFRLVEASKSRALADLLARYARGKALQEAKRGGKVETRAKLLKLIEDLNWYSSQAGVEDEKGERRSAVVAQGYQQTIAIRERQVAQLFRRLESEDSAFAQLQVMQQTSASDLQKILEADETAVEYFIVGDKISAFVITRQQIRVARNIASLREVEERLASLRFQLEKFAYHQSYVEAHADHLKRGMDEHLTALYEAVFEPLELMIENDKLIILPHGALHYVPFQALNDGAEYLVEMFEMSSAPSAAVLGLCRERSHQSQIANRKRQRATDDGQRDNRKLVAFGVSENDTPFIDDEIRTLGNIFADAVILTNGKATRENLLRLAPTADYLHIACHGYFRSDNPMFSYLKLADSHLNFYSLLDLKLKAEMVTLSACQTGVNAIFPGDELHGLMRGFLYAGAPSMVVSLWSVSDRSTTELMREMYASLQTGVTKRAALRAAQLKVKRDYPHPYYWAAFVLMGNPV